MQDSKNGGLLLHVCELPVEGMKDLARTVLHATWGPWTVLKKKKKNIDGANLAPPGFSRFTVLKVVKNFFHPLRIAIYSLKPQESLNRDSRFQKLHKKPNVKPESRDPTNPRPCVSLVKPSAPLVGSISGFICN